MRESSEITIMVVLEAAKDDYSPIPYQSRAHSGLAIEPEQLLERHYQPPFLFIHVLTTDHPPRPP